ncbi:DUF5667 domain-containing protein [Kitasatospora azatica]|uniref:DUF5667 domain-containing protein n=1 Tax=Kitasatospora azatica TaxID=58347 RepID=UPI0005607B6A|nr:DUF5667 domain-containing protein [Kitasatospora azatica]
MTANVLEHRRAKAFAEALEAHRTGQELPSEPVGNAPLRQLLDTAEALGSIAKPGLGAETRAVQRAQLMAAFEQTVAGGGLLVPRQRRHRAERVGHRRRWGRRFAITGLVAGVTVGSFAGVATASSGALPGDPLYGMKRGLEGLRLDLAGSDAERGSLLLDQASTRLEEARSLVGQGSASGLSPETVSRLGAALKDMHAEAAKGRELLRSVYRANGSLDPMRKLAEFTEAQDNHWNDLQPQLPAQLTPVAGQVDQLFGDMNEDVAPLHLDPAQGRPGGGHPASPAAGSSNGPAPSGSPVVGEGAHPAEQGAPGSHQGASQSPAGGAAQGGSAPANPVGGNPVGGLVNGLTGSLTGQAPAASPAPSGPAQGSPAADSGASPDAPAASPSATPSAPQGLNLPPLIPGLLPGLGLDGS